MPNATSQQSVHSHALEQVVMSQLKLGLELQSIFWPPQTALWSQHSK